MVLPFETPRGRRLSLRSSFSSTTTTLLSSESECSSSSSSDSEEDSQSKSPILKSRAVYRRLNSSSRRSLGNSSSSRASSSSTNNYNNIFPWILTVTAALLLHWTGLQYGVWRFRDGSGSELPLAALGAVTEGVLLLLLLQRLACWTVDAPLAWYWNRNNSTVQQQTQPLQSPTYSQCCCRLLLICRTLASAVTFCVISFIIITSTLGDAYYRAESGGLTPEIWVLAAFYMNAAEYVSAKLVADASTSSNENNAAASSDSSGEPQQDRKVNEADLNVHMIVCFFGAIALYLLGQWYQRRHSSKERQQQRFWSTVDCRNNKLLLAATVLTLASYAIIEAWTPVTHAFLCFTGRWFFIPGGQYQFDFVDQPVTTPDRSHAPNVLYLVHESLSGSILEKTDGGRHATPFFHSLLDHEDFYVFPHARSVSGDTRDCTTALLTGCLPLDEAGRHRAYGRSMGTEFKRRGYATMTVTSYPMNFDQTAWFMMQNYMGGNMDVVVDPLSTGLPKINIEGCDDRELLPYLDQWIKEDVMKKDRPFYGQFYTSNQHYPFLVDANSTASTRYYSSLESFDLLLKHIFHLLEEIGQLDNTIIVGSGDHGEHPDLTDYIRLKRFNSDVINTATYLWAPRHLFPSDETRDRLRRNTEQTISTLDLFPTIQHFLYGGDAHETANLRAEHQAADTLHDRDHCVTGYDLLSTEIADDRLAVQWNKISNPMSGDKGNFLGALSGRDRGLYVKGRGGNAHVSGSFHAMELDYGECTTAWDADCAIELTEERRQYWLQVLAESRPSSMISDQLRDTKHMRLLRDVLQGTQPSFATIS